MTNANCIPSYTKAVILCEILDYCSVNLQPSFEISVTIATYFKCELNKILLTLPNTHIDFICRGVPFTHTIM